MINNEKILLPYFKQLYDKLINKDFVNDTVELIGVQIKNLNPLQSIFNFNEIKKTNKKYCQKELDWYLSQNLNIAGWVDDITIWKQISDKDGFINSNYGWCIFSKENYNQYYNCLEILKKNKNTRQAVMIYNRPEMWYDYNINGMKDWMCTYSNQFFIRNNKLISLYIMRSNDAIYGFLNDFYWACYVYNKLYNELKEIYFDLEIGYINWYAGSWHLYERHFNLLKQIVESYE